MNIKMTPENETEEIVFKVVVRGHGRHRKGRLVAPDGWIWEEFRIYPNETDMQAHDRIMQMLLERPNCLGVEGSVINGQPVPFDEAKLLEALEE